MIYPIVLTPDDNDTLLVTCPALPEVTSFGEDKADALAHAFDAIEEALAGRIAHDEDIPMPRPRKGPSVRLPLLTSLKVLLYLRAREVGLSRADLGRRLGWHREQVDRLFRLDHHSRLDQLEAAFRALASEIEVSVRAAA
jgi:antitoxin HicB